MATKQAPGWFAVPFALVGVWILLVALDVVPTDPSTLYAPRWVMGLCGLVFLGAGALIWINLHGSPWMSDTAAFVIIASMALVASWIAFGPGDRHFGGSIGLGPISVGTANSTLGRIVFGFCAVTTWMIALIPLWRVAASFLRPSLKGQSRAAG